MVTYTREPVLFSQIPRGPKHSGGRMLPVDILVMNQIREGGREGGSVASREEFLVAALHQIAMESQY